MKKIIEISKLVRTILESEPETRDDDNLLWLEAVREWAYERDMLYVLDWSIASIMKNIHTLDIPTYETVSRERRRLQEKCPELRGTERVRKGRAKREKVYKEVARNGGVL